MVEGDFVRYCTFPAQLISNVTMVTITLELIADQTAPSSPQHPVLSIEMGIGGDSVKTLHILNQTSYSSASSEDALGCHTPPPSLILLKHCVQVVKKTVLFSHRSMRSPPPPHPTYTDTCTLIAASWEHQPVETEMGRHEHPYLYIHFHCH